MPQKFERVVEVDGLQSLWAQVLLLAWQDAFPVLKDGKAWQGPRQAQHARGWFGSGDFFHVCSLAGFDGRAVLDRFRAQVASGEAAAAVRAPKRRKNGAFA